MKRTPLRRKTPIKRVSKRRRAEMKDYSAKREKLLTASPVCEVCKRADSTDVHHKKGRGRYYLRVDTWLAVCRTCHGRIHEYPQWARREGLILGRGHNSSSGHG